MSPPSALPPGFLFAAPLTRRNVLTGIAIAAGTVALGSVIFEDAPSFAAATTLWPNGTTTLPTITSPFGQRNGRLHAGTDFVGFTTVRAVQEGIVQAVGWQPGWSGGGYQVLISHANFTSRYLHMQEGSAQVYRGQRVFAGAALGTMGNTGTSSFGVHLHLEINPGGGQVDPVAYLTPIINGAVQPAPAPQEEADMLTVIWQNKIFTVGQEFIKYETNIDQAKTMAWLLNRNDRMQQGGLFVGVDDSAMNAIQKTFSIPWYAVDAVLTGKGYNIEGTLGDGSAESGRVWSRQLELNAKLDKVAAKLAA